MQNHYYDNTHPLRPYTHSLPAMPGTLPPVSALRGEKPEIPPGQWPCEQGDAWIYVEDHRDEEGYVNGEPFTIKELGPYPPGWSKNPPPPTPEEQMQALVTAVDTYMNDFARTRYYDTMASAASYAGDPDPQFNKEGTYCRDMRSAIYRKSWDILADVESGKRPIPTEEEMLAELPKLVWPA